MGGQEDTIGCKQQATLHPASQFMSCLQQATGMAGILHVVFWRIQAAQVGLRGFDAAAATLGCGEEAA